MTYGGFFCHFFVYGGTGAGAGAGMGGAGGTMPDKWAGTAIASTTGLQAAFFTYGEGAPDISTPRSIV